MKAPIILILVILIIIFLYLISNKKYNSMKKVSIETVYELQKNVNHYINQ